MYTSLRKALVLNNFKLDHPVPLNTCYIIHTVSTLLVRSHLWFRLQERSQQRWYQGSGDSGSPDRSGGGSTVKNHPLGLFHQLYYVDDIRDGLRSNLSHQLGVNFGDAVDGSRPLHAQIWSRVPGGGGPERADGAGDKESQTVLGRDVQDVVKPCRQRQEATPQPLFAHLHIFRPNRKRPLDWPVMLTERARDTLASPMALRRAL